MLKLFLSLLIVLVAGLICLVRRLDLIARVKNLFGQYRPEYEQEGDFDTDEDELIHGSYEEQPRGSSQRAQEVARRNLPRRPITSVQIQLRPRFYSMPAPRDPDPWVDMEEPLPVYEADRRPPPPPSLQRDLNRLLELQQPQRYRAGPEPADIPPNYNHSNSSPRWPPADSQWHLAHWGLEHWLGTDYWLTFESRSPCPIIPPPSSAPTTLPDSASARVRQPVADDKRCPSWPSWPSWPSCPSCPSCPSGPSCPSWPRCRSPATSTIFTPTRSHDSHVTTSIQKHDETSIARITS